MMLISCLSCITFVLTYCTTLQAATDADVLRKGKEKFGNSVYKSLSKGKGNLLFSPLSVHVVLALLYYGAAGSTKAALKNALGLPERTGTAKAYKSIIDQLKTKTDEDCSEEDYDCPGHVTLEMANKIYAANSLKLVNKFKTDSRNYFNGDIEIVNFKEEKATTDRINKWVAKKTNNTIKSIINEPLPPFTLIVLLNALYIDGKWQHQFDDIKKKQKFYTSKTDMGVCSMIRSEEKYEYKKYSHKGYQFVRLPLIDKVFSFTIILPNSKTGLAKLEKKFVSNPSFFDLRGESKYVSVTLPKFKIEKEIDLNSILRQIGLKEIFEKVNIPEMLKPATGLKVGGVKQKVFIDVNENGIRAGATSSWFVFHTTGTFGKPVNFTADHPFLFLLEALIGEERHVLFQGRVTKPKYN